jgi:hypothetical protein
VLIALIAVAFLLSAAGTPAGQPEAGPQTPSAVAPRSVSERPTAAPTRRLKHGKKRAAAAPAPVPVTPKPPPASLRPSQMPPSPPRVQYNSGMLSIAAENSTLADILNAVRTQTGAAIEVPGSATGERVAVHLGPASPREVVAALLNGSNFDYVIVGAEADPNAVRRLIVIQRQGAPGPGSPATASGPPRSPLPGMNAPADEDAEDQAEEARPGQPRVQAPIPGMQPSGLQPRPLGIQTMPEGAAPASPNGQPAVKTPEQLLEELKRMQQQQQQQQQQPPPTQRPPQ